MTEGEKKHFDFQRWHNQMTDRQLLDLDDRLRRLERFERVVEEVFGCIHRFFLLAAQIVMAVMLVDLIVTVFPGIPGEVASWPARFAVWYQQGVAVLGHFFMWGV